MSLLESINLKKNNLKKTDTQVTQLDGKIYKESKENKIEEIGRTNGFVIDLKPDKIPAKIIENLYLGSQDCCDFDVLNTFDIKTVLSIGVDTPVTYPNITYTFIDCLDLPQTNLCKVLNQALPFIDNSINNNNNVLVHCNAGVSRSSSIVIGFLILKKGYSYNESYEICKNARSCVKPNSGFIKQLKLLNEDLKYPPD